MKRCLSKYKICKYYDKLKYFDMNNTRCISSYGRRNNKELFDNYLVPSVPYLFSDIKREYEVDYIMDYCISGYRYFHFDNFDEKMSIYNNMRKVKI